MQKISVIIPAFNEREGISRILSIICDISWIDEVFVIDDGSKDATSVVVRDFEITDNRIHLIRNERNEGKGQAVYNGINVSTGDTIVTLDADLRGLQPYHLHDLVSPVINQQSDMTLAIFKGGKWYSDLSHFLTPWLTGQRCIRRKLLEAVSWKAAAGYGLETAFTITAQQQSWRIQKIIWRGVSHPPSEGHRGLFLGEINRIKMYLQIIRAWFLASFEKVD